MRKRKKYIYKEGIYWMRRKKYLTHIFLPKHQHFVVYYKRTWEQIVCIVGAIVKERQLAETDLFSTPVCQLNQSCLCRNFWRWSASRSRISRELQTLGNLWCQICLGQTFLSLDELSLDWMLSMTLERGRRGGGGERSLGVACPLTEYTDTSLSLSLSL